MKAKTNLAFILENVLEPYYILPIVIILILGFKRYVYRHGKNDGRNKLNFEYDKVLNFIILSGTFEPQKGGEKIDGRGR